MTINELMVGDLVSLFQGRADNTECAVRVTSIDKHVIGIENKDCEYDCTTPPLLFPIPLNEEILVKNGFVVSDRANTYELNTDYYEIEVWDYSDGMWVIKVQYIEFSSIPYSQIIVSYVHQLQHLLRLCGIDKEIVL